MKMQKAVKIVLGILIVGALLNYAQATYSISIKADGYVYAAQGEAIQGIKVNLTCEYRDNQWINRQFTESDITNSEGYYEIIKNGIYYGYCISCSVSVDNNDPYYLGATYELDNPICRKNGNFEIIHNFEDVEYRLEQKTISWSGTITSDNGSPVNQVLIELKTYYNDGTSQEEYNSWTASGGSYSVSHAVKVWTKKPSYWGFLNFSAPGYINDSLYYDNEVGTYNAHLRETLHVVLEDENGSPVSGGTIDVTKNGASVLSKVWYATGEQDYYIPVDASHGTVNVSYSGTAYYEPAKAEVALSDTEQKKVTLTAHKTTPVNTFWNGTVTTFSANGSPVPLQGVTVTQTCNYNDGEESIKSVETGADGRYEITDTFYVRNAYLGQEDCILTYSKQGYVTPEPYNPAPGEHTGINVDKFLDPNLKVHLTDDNGTPEAVTMGMIVINNSDNTETLAQESVGGGIFDFYFGIDPQDVIIYYLDTSFYTNESRIASVNGVNQTEVNITTNVTWSTPINAFVMNNGSPITPDLIESNDIICHPTYCLATRNQVDITVKKQGYVSNTTAIPANNNGNPVNVWLNTTLRLKLVDDNGTPEPVKQGIIRINDSSNTATVFEKDLSGNNEMYHYIPIAPGDYYIHYIRGGNYSPVIASSLTTITDSQQMQKEMVAPFAWEYIVNAYDENANKLSDYNVVFNDTVFCEQGLCYVPKHSYVFNVTKAGYVTNTSGYVPEIGSRGSEFNATLNATLHMYVIDTENNTVDGMLNVTKNGQELLSANVSSGYAYLPVDPSWNAQDDINVTFTGGGYQERTLKIDKGTISDEFTTFLQMVVGKIVSLIISASDAYTYDPVKNVTVNATYENEIFECGGSVCNFNTLDHPSRVNLTISAPGYVNYYAYNVSITQGTYGVKMEPAVSMYVMANDTVVSVINTMGTESTHDDETYETKNVSSDGFAAFYLPDEFEFYLLFSAYGYDDALFGPYKTNYTSGEPIKFGSKDSKFDWGAESGQVYSPPGVPRIDLVWTEPDSPNDNDNITAYARATDLYSGKNNITECVLSIDGGENMTMEGEYGKIEITVHKFIGKLSKGMHRLNVTCKDNDSGWSDTMTKILMVSGTYPDVFVTYPAFVTLNT